MLRDDVIDERYHDVEAEQHEQPLANEHSPLGDKTLHSHSVYNIAR